MAAGARRLDYGMAEALAFGSLLRAGHARPAERAGQRARHVQPAARRARGHRDRAEVHAARPPGAGPGALRDLQLDAVRGGRARVRVRLQPRLPRGAGALGGAVRRLRQQRAGDHRPVPQRRRGQVGPAVRPRAAAAARLRGAGARALQRPHRALPAAGRRGQPAGLPAVDRRAVLPHAAAPGAARLAQAAGRLHAEEHAAPRRLVVARSRS